ncbi:universal stress protein [Halalkalicoccus salilacus]|uniref:universal stress protein n=1 Tax=Halalkalicoccus salilacus TaxID=3117459 RepID=UPI00300EB831
MYDDVLFPTDGSENAEAAFEYALSLAERYDAWIHALYVVYTTYSDVGTSGNTTIDSFRERGEAPVRAVEERATAESVEVVARIEEDDPHSEIIEYSGTNADLIVMGTRGRSGLDRYLLGSVTEKVVRTTDVPVFTVRGGDR